MWAARGKTHQEIAEILGIGPGSVKSHLDSSRHKLHCINLAHAVGIAVANGVIPSEALREVSSAVIPPRAHTNSKLTRSGRTSEKRGGMSDLGGTRRDKSRHRPASEFWSFA